MSRLDDIINGLPFTLTDEQDFFLRDFTSGNGHATLIGDGGSGKTTVMWVLDKYYNSDVVFGGSSGIATVNLPDNIGLCTGHSMLKLSVGEAIDKDYKRSAIKALTGSDQIKVIILDEAYCYNSQDLDQMLNQVRKLNKATSKRRARNIRLLLVGDPLQRLPIVDDKLRGKLYDNFGHYLMFKSSVWKRFNPACYVFQEVKRQDGTSPKDIWFKKCLYVLRYGIEKHYDKVLEGLNKLVVGDDYEEGSLYIAPTNALVDEYNRTYLENNPNNKVSFTAKFDAKYDKFQFPLEKVVTLAEGCKVICLVNDQEGSYQNGTEIAVTSILEDEGIYGRKENGDEIFVAVHEFKQEDIEFVETPVQEVNSSEKRKLILKHCDKKLLVKTLKGKFVDTADESFTEDKLPYLLGCLSTDAVDQLYIQNVKDKAMHQERVHIASAYMLPVKLSAGFVCARVQGRTFNRKGLIDVGDPAKDYFYTWNKMPDFMVAGLFVALGRFTSIDHIQLKRPIEKRHIKVDRDSINFWWECVSEFNKRREGMI